MVLGVAMGLTINNKHSKDYDMGYITFYRLRKDIEYYLYNIAQKDIEYYVYNIVQKDIYEMPQQGTISFLKQSDCKGKLTPKECKEFLQDIKNMEDKGVYYGYVGRGAEYCLTITKLKVLLQSCVSHRCNLRWF